MKKKIKKKKIRKIKKKKFVKLEKKQTTNVFKSNLAEEKVIIKKIKKQPSQKRIYNVNDFVVYPKHGVGKIMSVEKAVVGDININFYKVFIDKDKLTLTIPINQQSNLRPIT